MKPGAPTNNRNAVKDDGDKSESFLYIRCRKSDKAAWIKAAKGKKLSEWVIATLNKKTGE